MRVTMTVNDAALEADDAWEGESLLYVLPEPACACLIAAGQARGRDVRTVAGLHDGPRLDPIQQAFLDAGAVQCGFCTPGLLVAAHDLLRRYPDPGEAHPVQAGDPRG
jgi:carbon-monoxide dehydrogenase small subunit